jgi:hypothetical protein
MLAEILAEAARGSNRKPLRTSRLGKTIMERKANYMKHMWQWRKGRFVCLRRKCKAIKGPETSDICRLWDQGKKKNG